MNKDDLYLKIRDILVEQFDVAEDGAQRDVADFLSRLRSLDLI